MEKTKRVGRGGDEGREEEGWKRGRRKEERKKEGREEEGWKKQKENRLTKK